MYQTSFIRKLLLILGLTVMTLIITSESVDIAPEEEFIALSIMANPAAVYCDDLGYIYEVIHDPLGEVGTCSFPDGDACDAWEFLKGKCGQSHSYCAQNGYDIKTMRDGKDPFSQEYAVCVSSKDEDVGSVTELSGLSEKSMNCDANESIQMQSYPMGKSSEGDVVQQPEMDGAPPSAFNWHDILGCDWLTSIKDQGYCGSCWAFSAMGAAEAAHNISADDVALDLDLSEQYLVSDCHMYGGYQTCCGGYKSIALEEIRDNGIPDDACFPYGDLSDCTCVGATCDSNCTYNDSGICSDSTCSDKCADWDSRLVNIDTTAFVGSGEAAIKQALLDKGPLAVSMGIGDSFGGHWEGDIYRCTNDSSTNHAVIVVGWDDAGSYWVVRNSWGASWDTDGYFKLGYGECHIEYSPYYATVNTSGNDNFQTPTVIGGVSYSNTQDVSSASSSCDDPPISVPGFSGQGYYSAWYKYVSPADGTLSVDTFGSDYDTVLAIWTGHRGSLTMVDGNDDSVSPPQSKVELSVSAGTTYYLEIVGADSGAYGNLTLNLSLAATPADILLVDDDDNIPDVRSYYTTALDALGVSYYIWDTDNGDNEPDVGYLSSFTTVIWFSGSEWGGYAGPGSAGEAALASFLEGGKCLFISSQEYHYDRGLTTFMSTYLGVDSATSDVYQTTVTGVGSVYGGLGPYSLSYPFTNYSDRISPDSSADLAFSGNQGDAAVYKESGVYFSSYWGFPFEAIPNSSDRQSAMSAFLDSCNPITPTPTATSTNTPTSTSTDTPTPTSTSTSTSTLTPTATPTATSTNTATPTDTPTVTSTSTSTSTPTSTATPTVTDTPTITPTPTDTPTSTSTSTSTPTSTPTATPTSTPTSIFGDVPFGHWAYDNINALYEAGYVAGCSAEPRLYCPDRALNRAEGAVFVERGIHDLSYFPDIPTSRIFKDVPLNNWAAKWVTALWEDGYTAGCTLDHLYYCPWQGNTRAEGSVFFLKMLYGSDYFPDNPTVPIFEDVPLDIWYAKWVHAAYDAGLLLACQDDPLLFCPNTPLTRDWAAYMMVQAKGGLPLLP